MNHPSRINAFVDWLETNPLDLITQALWFHLAALANKCNAPGPFTVTNLTLQAKLGVDKKTLIKHRNILIEKGLIAYQNRGRAAGQYQMLPIGRQQGTPAGDDGEIPPRGERAVDTGENIAPRCEQAVDTGVEMHPPGVPGESTGEDNPPQREPDRNTGGENPPARPPDHPPDHPPNLPPNLPPNRPPVREPVVIPLIKQNSDQTSNKYIYTICQAIFKHWNQQEVITHRRLSPGQRRLIKARLAEGYTADEILAAIDNYAVVVHGDEYYWTHRWGLDEFLLRGLDRFKPASDPRTNFLRDRCRSPGQGRAQAGADKYAGYVNRTVGYHDL